MMRRVPAEINAELFSEQKKKRGKGGVPRRASGLPPTRAGIYFSHRPMNPSDVPAAAPLGVDKDSVPGDMVEKERSIFAEQVRASGKPENLIDKIVDGKVEAYYKDVALLHQAWVREPKKTVGDLIKETSARVGENIQVRRFVRYQLGEA